MLFTAAQCRAGRALLGWSQEQLASTAKVTKATLANFEASLSYPQDRTLADIRGALEAGGIKFDNGGVWPRQLTSDVLKPLHVVSSSDLSVRLRTSDGEYPIVVAIERSAIDDHFRLSSSSKQLRRDIVESNLSEIFTIAIARYKARNYSIGQSAGTKFLQIVMRENDLKGRGLKLPSDE
jgi:transcriptional regulator with XRE-family HTH domain